MLQVKLKQKMWTIFKYFSRVSILGEHGEAQVWISPTFTLKMLHCWTHDIKVGQYFKTFATCDTPHPLV